MIDIGTSAGGEHRGSAPPTRSALLRRDGDGDGDGDGKGVDVAWR
ncbi:hypothetical protein ACUN7V_03815 [Quadrisphaera oryzae]|nr:hypothetical protein [Quadrisphaera sp. RL12-1S]